MIGLLIDLPIKLLIELHLIELLIELPSVIELPIELLIEQPIELLIELTLFTAFPLVRLEVNIPMFPMVAVARSHRG